MDQDKIRKEMEQLIKTRAAKSELEVCEFYHLYLMTLIRTKWGMLAHSIL